MRARELRQKFWLKFEWMDGSSEHGLQEKVSVATVVFPWWLARLLSSTIATSGCWHAFSISSADVARLLKCRRHQTNVGNVALFDFVQCINEWWKESLKLFWCAISSLQSLIPTEDEPTCEFEIPYYPNPDIRRNAKFFIGDLHFKASYCTFFMSYFIWIKEQA